MPLTASKMRRAEHVDADQRQVRARLARLLDQLRDAAVVVQLGHAVVLRLVDRRQHDLGVPVAGLEAADQVADAALDDVVAQEHHEAIVAQEVLADLDGVGQAQRRLLRDEGDLDPPAAAVADRLADLARIVIHAHHDADVVDAGIADRLDHPEEHRLVGHRDQLLGVGVGDGIEARAFTAAEDQTFHCDLHSLRGCAKT